MPSKSNVHLYSTKNRTKKKEKVSWWVSTETFRIRIKICDDDYLTPIQSVSIIMTRTNYTIYRYIFLLHMNSDHDWYAEVSNKINK